MLSAHVPGTNINDLMSKVVQLVDCVLVPCCVLSLGWDRHQSASSSFVKLVLALDTDN